MKNIRNPGCRLSLSFIFFFLCSVAFFLIPFDSVYAQQSANIVAEQGSLGFQVPDLADFLTFAVRFFFILAGIAALVYGLWGAFSWVTSGGQEENIEKSRNKIIAALAGVILIVAVLAVIVAFEQFVFQQRVCFGLSCPVVIPGILERCVPNPQFGRTEQETAKLRFENPGWTDEVPGNAPGGFIDIGPDVKCCPLGLPEGSPDAVNLRITTGWGAGTEYYQLDRHKICCIFGDTDGNQICDGWDQGIGIFPL